MNLVEAQSLVQAELDNETDLNGADRCVILEAETIKTEWGWVFFYQSKDYIESGEIGDMLAGNAPYIVNKYSGQIVATGTAHDIEYYIREYEKIIL